MKKLFFVFVAVLCVVANAHAGKGYTNDTAPATCVDGDFWIDTNGTTSERFHTCEEGTWVKHLGNGTTSNPSFLSVHASGGNLAAANKQVTKAWQTGLSYTADVTSVIHGGKHWIAKTTHTAGSTTEPGVGASYADAWTEVSGAGDDLGDSAYSDVVALWTTCTGYLKSDGTCDTPSGSATYPGSAGVAYWNGSAWGTSYTVGTAANNLLSLNSSGQLPFTIDVSDLTDNDGLFTAKANASCFASESAFNTCFDLTWASGGATSLSGLSDWPSAVSATEVGYLDGATSNLQSQIDALSVGAVPFVSDTTPPSTGGTINYSTSDYKLRARHSNGDVYASAAFTLETAADTTPAAITFTDVTGATTSTVYTDCKQITGINWPAAVSTTGGTAAICTSATYATDCGTFGTSPGNVSNNGYVCARITSSGSANTAVNNVVTVGGGEDTFTVTTAGSSYTDILFHWNAENTYTADKGGITATNNGAIFSSTAKVGTYAFARDSNYDYSNFSISTSHFKKAGGQIGFWFQTDNGFQAGSYNQFLHVYFDTDNFMNVRVHSSGGIRVGWQGNNVDSYCEYTASALAQDTWYYVVIFWKPGDSGNDLRLTIYNEAGDTVGAASVANITAMTQDPNILQFGSSTSDAQLPIIDNFVISDDTARTMWDIRNVTNF